MIYRNRRDELENQLNRGALWAVTYGDLMSYLMIFFLVLFSFSIARNDKAKNRKYEESLANIQQAFGGLQVTRGLERAKAQEQEQAAADKLMASVPENLAKIESSETKLKVVLGEGVLFDSGRADLKVKAKEVLLPIIEELKKLPNSVVVEGHTDTLPIRGGKFSTNWELSMARAYSVISYMESQGMDKKKLAGIGYGENRPVADNATPTGRAQNRRIEISLLKTE